MNAECSTSVAAFFQESKFRGSVGCQSVQATSTKLLFVWVPIGVTKLEQRTDPVWRLKGAAFVVARALFEHVAI